MSEAPPEWKPERFLDHARAREIPRALLRHRKSLRAIYVAVWIAFWLTVLLFPAFVPAVLRLEWREWPRFEIQTRGMMTRLGVFLIFLGLQAAMIWTVGAEAKSSPRFARGRQELACALCGLQLTIWSLCVVFLLGTITLPDQLVPLLKACAAFLSGVGGAVAEFRAVPGKFFLTVSVFWAAWSILAWLLVHEEERDVAAWRLVGATLLAGALGISIALPLELALSNQQNGGLGTLVFAVPLLLWALGPAVYLLNSEAGLLLTRSDRRIPNPTGSAPAPVLEIGAESLDSTEYISLARSYSIVLLVALYVSIDGCREYLDGVRKLTDARHAFAEIYVREGNRTSRERVTGVGLVEVNPAGITPVRSRKGSGRRAPQVQFGSPPPEVSNIVDVFELSVTRDDERRWHQVVDLPSAQNGRPATNELDVANAFRSQLSGLYQIVWHKEPEKPKYDAWLSDIEYELVDQTIPVPGLDLKFRSETVPWVFSFVAMAFVVQIRNQVRRGLLDPTLGLAEPWLVLDGQRGLERLLAQGWLLMVAAAPWIANGCLLAYLGTTHAGGRIESVAVVLLRVGLALPLLLVGGRISLTVCAEMLRLRRIRLRRLNSVKERFETEMVVRQS